MDTISQLHGVVAGGQAGPQRHHQLACALLSRRRRRGPSITATWPAASTTTLLPPLTGLTCWSKVSQPAGGGGVVTRVPGEGGWVEIRVGVRQRPGRPAGRQSPGSASRAAVAPSLAGVLGAACLRRGGWARSVGVAHGVRCAQWGLLTGAVGDRVRWWMAAPGRGGARCHARGALRRRCAAVSAGPRSGGAASAAAAPPRGARSIRRTSTAAITASARCSGQRSAGTPAVRRRSPPQQRLVRRRLCRQHGRDQAGQRRRLRRCARPQADRRQPRHITSAARGAAAPPRPPSSAGRP